MAFGDKVVLDHLNLDVRRGEILGFVGASGTGKSVLMRTILKLVPRKSGSISILGHDYDTLDAKSVSRWIRASASSSSTGRSSRR